MYGCKCNIGMNLNLFQIIRNPKTNFILKRQNQKMFRTFQSEQSNSLQSTPKLCSQKTSDKTTNSLSSNCKSFSRSEDNQKSMLSSEEILNMISPFSPYLDSISDRTDCERSSITDRFIPSRKLLKKDSLFQEDQDLENLENLAQQPCDSNSLQVSEIYRKYIMADHKNKERPIDCFQNNNILKYTKNPDMMADPPLMSKNSSLEFTEELVGNAKSRRKINKLPCKVLDAPALQDDYYLNLIDWSTQDFLAVGLSSSVYLWNSNNSKVTKLCDLGMSDTVTSVSWSLKGPLFALGTNSGQVQIWDVNKMKRTRVFHGHTNRVGSMSWNSTILSTGSRDKSILHRDLRSSTPFFSKLEGHKQEICGLKWSFDQQQLCSGGNDNKLLVWNAHSTQPILKYNDHSAAVKAMTWSPHQHGLLVSGGGTADRTIRFRNTLTGTTIKTVEVGSQVCNLMFSKTLNELVSTHGYSQNEINIWKYPSMKKITTLTGHTFRVLYLAMSPDGNTIVTGAGDETLRFWNVFPSRNDEGKKGASFLNVENAMLR